MTCAQAQDADLAKKLSNPVASLISMPFQFNYNTGYGPADGDNVTLNIQPVIPISLNEKWNLISRTIVSVVWQDDIVGNSGTQFGLSDTTQSLFLPPKDPGPCGIIWGLGPVFLLPTGTDSLLSTEKWGAGPTGVVLKQSGPWTYGILGNHFWSFAGDSSRSEVNSTFLQPFLAYTTPTAGTFTLNSESTYDWTNNEWSIPINAMVAKVVRFGEQPVSFQAGVRYWADSAPGGPGGLGARFTVAFLSPTGN
ncbi:transporter [Rhizobiales bacterium]|uniref:transporter n=1 Tax=Hongsoonwoonella zoysiae TaxID=2821844 RepID=UPI00156117E9|nr:transporter [Hongsoonwoonella zoysiae]